MKHMVLGQGNLGHDLYREIGKNPNYEPFFPRWRYDGTIESVQLLEEQRVRPDVVWVAIGCGSVHEAKKDFRATLDRTVHLARDLMDTFTDANLIFFTSDYVEGNEGLRSLYAYAKRWMEDVVEFANQDRFHPCSVVRVGSLYGKHRPERTFPGKLRARYPKPCKLTLPINLVTPTPTEWLAKDLVENFREFWNQEDRSPRGHMRVSDWGRLILGPEYEIVDGDYDIERPSQTNGGHHGTRKPTCHSLWEAYKI